MAGADDQQISLHLLRLLVKAVRRTVAGHTDQLGLDARSIALLLEQGV